MSIQIDMVRISNFRGIANLELSLPRVTVLLGQNNAGKTSVIKALQLALGDYSRYLSEEDFHINADQQKQEIITVDVRIISIKESTRTPEFSGAWQETFGDKIQAEITGKQFVALRTTVKPNTIKGGYDTVRHHLNDWPEFSNWLEVSPSAKNRLTKRLDAMPFISVEAQRDIHTELKEKSSYIGRILSNVKYNEGDIDALEDLVSEVNEQAISRSPPLSQLKTHLDKLNDSFNSSGKTELTPFPKKIRDLSKGFSIHFGESSSNSFSMEYHGMGTRSWASLLTVKAFTELLIQSHAAEEETFFPIIAAEEPEAHLHPNAQRTLYEQLKEIPGQVIISTHSPYIAGLAEIHEIRAIKNINNDVKVFQLRDSLDPEEIRKIKREVIHSRGELLFSKAIVLSEGETEEQVLPELFTSFEGKQPFSLGINFVAVHGSGAKYLPFLYLAHDLNIPVFIFSDGEPNIIKQLKKSYEMVYGSTDINIANNITLLDNTDFEGYLLNDGFQPLIEQAIINVNDGNSEYLNKWIQKKHDTQGKSIKTNQPPCITCKQDIFENPLRNYDGVEGKKRAILEILDSAKPKYAKAIAANFIEINKENYPSKITDLFAQIRSLM
ncbi:ATP-dependent nuclease [Providencia heimbachae]|uniref:Putative OLD family ATP-dependent endonuclease n=1 Tax=Providencia heimbachae ATCC 35613 TaxID=1354272 RepID=A0A1B7K2Z5_9GAMM|nr:AAA family ATPase [Providencia heimbachae]OAT54505.1 putative OLD family ATP-dependent endonuclease [Providencia heimbachae ATCC 35613]SQH13555.1 recombination protein F [Providencia heimbachae]